MLIRIAAAAAVAGYAAGGAGWHYCSNGSSEGRTVPSAQSDGFNLCTEPQHLLLLLLPQVMLLVVPGGITAGGWLSC